MLADVSLIIGPVVAVVITAVVIVILYKMIRYL